LFYGFRGAVSEEALFEKITELDNLVTPLAVRDESVSELKTALEEALRAVRVNDKALGLDAVELKKRKEDVALASIVNNLGVGGRLTILGDDGFKFGLELVCTGLAGFSRKFAFRQEFPDGSEIFTDVLGDGLSAAAALSLLVSGKILKFEKGLNPELVVEFSDEFGVILSYPGTERFVIKLAVFSENEKLVTSKLFNRGVGLVNSLPDRLGDFDSTLNFETLWPDLRVKDLSHLFQSSSNEGFKIIVDLPEAIGVLDYDTSNFSLSEALVLALNSTLEGLPVDWEGPLEFHIKASRIFAPGQSGGFELLVSAGLPLIGEWWHAVHKTFSHGLMQLVFSRLLETYKFHGNDQLFGNDQFLQEREFVLRLPVTTYKGSSRLKFEEAVLEVVI
jgi:hypothetical protein